MKYILLSVLFLYLQGCANKAFFSPSQAASFNPNIQWLPSSSGSSIAYLWLPANPTPPVKGIVAHFHGNSGHMEATKEKVDWLSEHGYDVMVFDYSGFGHSSGKVSDEAAYYDAITVLQYLATVRSDTQLPLFVIATSTGGNIFMRAQADYPVAIDGMIIDSSFTSYINEAEYILNKGFLGNWYSWLAHVVIRDDYAVADRITAIPETNSLVIHCESDSVVPIASSEAIHNQLLGNKHFWRFSDCSHARAMTNEFPDNQQRIVEWLEQSVEEWKMFCTPKSVIVG
ncbi:alpha/beta hydrolase [Photobacterium kasasachensis]|uniref:alpha/beta hydrolase n=1 Tax=Photobacterium kasasachensis TaxID=2910240 RepID=UPI003D150FDE